jgi:hypothetical protein
MGRFLLTFRANRRKKKKIPVCFEPLSLSELTTRIFSDPQSLDRYALGAG